MQAITPHVFTFTNLLMGRVYAIKAPDGITLIDTGLAYAAPQIAKQLAAEGHSLESVKRIIITHAHPDHVGGLMALKEMTEAEVVSSETERPIIEGKEAASRPINPSRLDKLINASPWYNPHPVTVDRTVVEGDTFTDLLGGLEVIAAPGHTYGQIALWSPTTRVLFTADAILQLPRLRKPFSAFTADMNLVRQTIQKLAALQPAVLCFGHGDPITVDAAKKLDAFAAKVSATG